MRHLLIFFQVVLENLLLCFSAFNCDSPDLKYFSEQKDSKQKHVKLQYMELRIQMLPINYNLRFY